MAVANFGVNAIINLCMQKNDDEKATHVSESSLNPSYRISCPNDPSLGLKNDRNNRVVEEAREYLRKKKIERCKLHRDEEDEQIFDVDDECQRQFTVNPRRADTYLPLQVERIEHFLKVDDCLLQQDSVSKVPFERECLSSDLLYQEEQVDNTDWRDRCR